MPWGQLSYGGRQLIFSTQVWKLGSCYGGKRHDIMTYGTGSLKALGRLIICHRYQPRLGWWTYYTSTGKRCVLCGNQCTLKGRGWYNACPQCAMLWERTQTSNEVSAGGASCSSDKVPQVSVWYQVKVTKAMLCPWNIMSCFVVCIEWQHTKAVAESLKYCDLVTMENLCILGFLFSFPHDLQNYRTGRLYCWEV